MATHKERARIFGSTTHREAAPGQLPGCDQELRGITG